MHWFMCTVSQPQTVRCFAVFALVDVAVAHNGWGKSTLWGSVEGGALGARTRKLVFGSLEHGFQICSNMLKPTLWLSTLPCHFLPLAAWMLEGGVTSVVDTILIKSWCVPGNWIWRCFYQCFKKAECALFLGDSLSQLLEENSDPDQNGTVVLSLRENLSTA